MVRASYPFVGLLVMAACDGVFDLTKVSIPIDSTADNDADADGCPYTMLDPGANADQDSELNGADPCPLVTNQDLHDEDGDLVPDACDLCPQLGAAGDDADCDQLGAACDPAETMPHERVFFGFGSALGLDVRSNASVTGDQVVIALPGAEGEYGIATTLTEVPCNAIYETTFTITGTFSEPGYQEAGLRFVDLDKRQWKIKLVSTSNARLAIGDDVVTYTTDVPLPTTQKIVMRAVWTGTSITATVSGGTTGTLTAEVGAPAEPVTYGVSAYQDTNPPAMTVKFDYLDRIVPKP